MSEGGKEGTMSAPLDRDKQIKLMQEAEARMEARMRGWMSNPSIKAVFAKPAPGQDRDVAVSHRKVPMKRCG